MPHDNYLKFIISTNAAKVIFILCYHINNKQSKIR